MALWFILLLPLFAVGESQHVNSINQTDLQAAMSDMRTRSYHGFVILLKILNSMPESLRDTDITFFMPNDEDLSAVAVTPDHLQDFILSHSIPTPLMLNHLLHFPNGTLVPSGIPSRMISITNNGKPAMFLNNARIDTPNVCISSLIRCHGISAALKFSDMVPLLAASDFKDASKTNNLAKPFPSIKQKSIPSSK
ncbi:FAS1 domain-containing protein [Quillaja saponaria]|uniref:FAS1 domain-containing protein n=1 Tax=Quillaja saponaria TaxID=32244 RepID=A0AAD7LLE5_QUISA|nr:FAS1 domain-containing protein [Quillaja saponaria]